MRRESWNDALLLSATAFALPMTGCAGGGPSTIPTGMTTTVGIVVGPVLPGVGDRNPPQITWISTYEARRATGVLGLAP